MDVKNNQVLDSVREVLADFIDFSAVCEDSGYTDTGDAWTIMNRMADALDLVLREVKTDSSDGVKTDGNVGDPIVDYRMQAYGDPVESFAAVSQMWSAFLDHDVQAWEVPIMMVLLKVARMKGSPDYSDHTDDINGYVDIFRRVMGEDLVHARTIDEYIAKKWPS